MFLRIGQCVARGWPIVLLVWAGIVAGSWWVQPDLERIAAAEPAAILPPDAPSSQALRLMERAFPEWAARSQAVIVFSRRPALRAGDWEYIQRVVQRLREQPGADVEGWRVHAPLDSPYHRRRMVSPDESCALVAVNMTANFTTRRVSRAVERMHALLEHGRPLGLETAITGSAGIGHDYAVATAAALDRTTWVTITLVVGILLVVYRAPVAAAIPLITISASVWVSFVVLDRLAAAGWAVGDLEKTFTVVLVFGAGTDFALFWLSRQREHLADGLGTRESAGRTTAAVGPAITASAATTIAGLATMTVARLSVLRVSGQVLGIGLAVALVASLTLGPALACLLGRAVYWPTRERLSPWGARSRLWNHLGLIVARRPGTVLGLGLVLLALPAARCVEMTFRYDTLAQLPPGSSAARGLALAENAFGVGALYPTTLLMPWDNPAEAERLSARLAERLAEIEGVSDVHCEAYPSGVRAGASAVEAVARRLAQPLIARYYRSEDPAVMRVEVFIEAPPLSLEAMSIVERVTAEARAVLREAGIAPRLAGGSEGVLAAGLTPYIIDIRRIVAVDQRWIMMLAPAVIWLIVLLLVRDVPLSAAMIGGTLLGFAAALGLTDGVVRLAGGSGLDYKVRIFLFVVMVAVGQDYNIYLVTRLQQEAREYGLREAVLRAIVRAGSVISSCGLIMAAALGSLMATGMTLYRQLGLAFATGILLATFVVMPLLMPGFYLLWRRLRERLTRAQAVPEESPLR